MGKKSGLGRTLITAAVVGAAGVAAVGLSNKNNRKKVGQIVSDLTKKADKLAKEANKSKMVKDAKRGMLNMASKAGKQAKPVAKKAVKKAVRKVSKKLN